MLQVKDGLYCINECHKKTETVLCPVCGVGHMVERKASKGKNKGNVFYGCSDFPKCKNIMSLEDYNKLK